jgi:hypothetical protein
LEAMLSSRKPLIEHVNAGRVRILSAHNNTNSQLSTCNKKSKIMKPKAKTLKIKSSLLNVPRANQKQNIK